LRVGPYFRLASAADKYILEQPCISLREPDHNPITSSDALKIF
jgi:hypothetical protein